MLTEAHADTPAVAHIDALGRPFLSVEHNRDEEEDDVFGETRLLLDVVGNVLEITDARDNVAETRTHGMLRQVLRVTSEDAGERRVLRDGMGAPCRAWNSRGFVTAIDYDEARRPLRTVVTRPNASTFTAVRMVYGEAVTSPESSNLRGRVFRVYDGAGLIQSNAFDFAGNLVSQTRQLTVTYDEAPSWSALDGLTDIGDLDSAAGGPTIALEYDSFAWRDRGEPRARRIPATRPAVSPMSSDRSVTYVAGSYPEGPSSEVRTSSAPLRGAFVGGPHLVAPPSRGLRRRSAPRRPPFEGHPSEVRTSSSPLRGPFGRGPHLARTPPRGGGA